MNPTTSQDALKTLQKTQSTAVDPNAYLAQQNKALGVDEAQSTVTGLRGAIDSTTKLLQQVAPSIMGRTATSLVNSAQAQRQIANEEAPISANLTDQSNQYTTANQNLSQLLDKATQAANAQYTGQQDKLSYLENVYNTLYQREQDAKTQAEAKRQYDASLAEQKREANLGSSSGSGYDLSQLLGSNSTKPTVQSLFEGYNPSTDRNYTESVVIPTLQQQGYSLQDAAKLAYQYRKKQFGE